MADFSRVIRMIVEKDYATMRLICVFCAVMFFGLTIMQYQSADEMSDYDTAPAYITDVTSREVINRKGVHYEYTYNVHWYYEDEWHVKTISGQIDPPDQELSEVRVNPVSKKMTIGSSEGSRHGANMTAIIVGILLVLYIILLVIDKNRLEGINQNCTLSIAMGVLGGIITGLCCKIVYSDSRYVDDRGPMIFLTALFVIMGIGGIIGKILIASQKNKGKR